MCGFNTIIIYSTNGALPVSKVWTQYNNHVC